ncbi:hypothetical protein BDAP_001161 [Binucleata daphniae]
MAEQNENVEKKGTKVVIFGYGLLGISVFMIALAIILSYFMSIGIYHNWYMFASLCGILIVQAVIFFLLKKSYSSIIELVLFLAFVTNMALVFYFATYQKLVGVDLDEFVGELSKWKAENRVYICVGKVIKAEEGDKATMETKDLKKIFDDAMKTNKEGEKVGLKNTFGHVKIDVKGCKTIKDAEALFKFIKSYKFALKLKTAFINISAAGLSKVAEGKVMKEQDFIALEKKRTGLDHVKRE